MRRDKMKKLGLKITAAAIVLASIGCGKTEKIIQMQDTGSQPETSNSQTYGTTVEGIETHGGSIRLARQELFRDKLQLSETDYRTKNVAANQDNEYEVDSYAYTLHTTKAQLFYKWLQLRMDLNKIQNQEVKEMIASLVDENSGKNIFQQIANLKIELKEVVPFNEKISKDELKNHPQYGFCYSTENNEQKIVTASTELGNLDASICIDLKLITQENPEDSELVALLSHEIAHQFGYTHTKATQLQSFIRTYLKNDNFIPYSPKIGAPANIPLQVSRRDILALIEQSTFFDRSSYSNLHASVISNFKSTQNPVYYSYYAKSGENIFDYLIQTDCKDLVECQLKFDISNSSPITSQISDSFKFGISTGENLSQVYTSGELHFVLSAIPSNGVSPDPELGPTIYNLKIPDDLEYASSFHIFEELTPEAKIQLSTFELLKLAERSGIEISQGLIRLKK